MAALRPVGRRSPRRCCAVRTAACLYARGSPSSYRGVCATCTALCLHTHPVDRGCHIASRRCFTLLAAPSCYRGTRCTALRRSAVTTTLLAPLCAADPPSRLCCSLRSSRRYDDDLRERRLCYTAPSRYVSPLRFSTTACRLRRRCVTRHPTRYRFIATPAHRAAAAARSFSTPLRYRSRLSLKFYLGRASSADHLAFKFYRLNFAQNRDRAPFTDLQAARRCVVVWLMAPPCCRLRVWVRAYTDASLCTYVASTNYSCAQAPSVSAKFYRRLI